MRVFDKRVLGRRASDLGRMSGAPGVALAEVVAPRLSERVAGARDEGVPLPARPPPVRGPGPPDLGEHRVVLLLGPAKALPVVLDVLPVVGLEEAQAHDLARIVPEDLPDRHEVPEALRHLLPLDRDET